MNPFLRRGHTWRFVTPCLLLCSGTFAQQNMIETLQGIDLAVSALPMKPYWQGGLLRVRVRGLPTDGSGTFRLDYGSAGIITLDATQLAARSVSKSSTDITLDLPIVAGQTMTVADAPAGLKVAALQVIYPSQIRPQQRIEGSLAVSLDDNASPLLKAHALAFGRLRAFTSTTQSPFDCTAFRVATGYWMTAAHCGYRSTEAPTRPAFTAWKLQIQDWAGQLEIAVPLDAQPVASGLRVSNPTAQNVMGGDDLDWMLLKVEGDPGGPILPLRVNAPQAADTPLELLQHSVGTIPPPAGKAYSTGESCKIDGDRASVGESNPELCLHSLRHGCSSQGGASGGPLVARKNFALVAIHYRAGLSGLWNCGVPAATVAQDLCNRFSHLAGKVLTCPSN